MDEGRPKINHPKNRKIAITFRRQPNALQVASERTTMEEEVPNRNILVSKFRRIERYLLLSFAIHIGPTNTRQNFFIK